MKIIDDNEPKNVCASMTFMLVYTIILCREILFSRNYHRDLLIWLVKEGHCDPNVRDNDGETVLHYACR